MCDQRFRAAFVLRPTSTMRDFAFAPPPPPPSPAPPVPRRLAVPDLPNAPPAAPFSFDSPTESLIASRSGELSFPRPAARRFLLSSVARRPPVCACCAMALNLRKSADPLRNLRPHVSYARHARPGTAEMRSEAISPSTNSPDLEVATRVHPEILRSASAQDDKLAHVGRTRPCYDGGSDCFHPALSCSDNFFTTAAWSSFAARFAVSAASVSWS